MESIFAGKLNLTDDIPDQPAVSERAPEQKLDHLKGWLPPVPPAIRAETWGCPSSRPLDDIRQFKTAAEQMQGTWNYVKDTYGQPQPLPEPSLSPAAQRVRAEAARLGIDYDAEVTRILHGPRWGGFAPNPGNRRAGPDPLKNVSDYDRRMAEHAAAENIRRKHGIRLTWEE